MGASPPRSTAGPDRALETPWYEDALVPLGVSVFLLAGIGIIYYRARRRPLPLSAGVQQLRAKDGAASPPD